MAAAQPQPDPTGSRRHAGLRDVLLLLGPTCEYTRRATEGVGRYALERGHWNVTISDSRHATQLLEDYDGIITATLSDMPADTFAPGRRDADTRLPQIVTIGSNADPRPWPAVLVDHRAVGELAAEHLLDIPLKTLAGCGPAAVYFSHLRLEAFSETAERHGFPRHRFDGDFPFLGFSPRQDLAGPVTRWLTALPKPAGVFAATDNIAVSLIRLCRSLGLRVPEDVAVIGVNDDLLMAATASTPLTSVILPGERVGYAAATLLEQLMNGQPPPQHPQMFSPLGIARRQSTHLLAADDAEAIAAYRYIQTHALEGISAVDVCERTRIARRTLERRFQKSFGRTINGMIQNLRLDHARHLLTTTDLPVGQIADAASFRHLGYFHQQFKKRFSITPQQYRQARARPVADAAVEPNG
jgi:LacI family transcriptional regulator